MHPLLQVILGHADLATTQIYTRVSLDKLKEIHRRDGFSETGTKS